MTDTPRDDYDTPWKAIVTQAFPEFMAFYFPAAAEIDWTQGHEFLDQELAQVVRDVELGRRLLDKLVRVATRDGQERWVFLHIEIQGQHDTDFAERLFVYILYDRNWDRQQIIDLFSIIDWMMHLPADLQRALWQDLEQLERNRRMPYITSVERIGMEKGIQEGIQQGKQLGAADMLLHLIERCFGPMSDVVRERITKADPNMLMQLPERILDAQKPDDLWH